MNESNVYFLWLTLYLSRDSVTRTVVRHFMLEKTSALSCRPNSAVTFRSVNGRDGNRAKCDDSDFDSASLLTFLLVLLNKKYLG